MEKAIRLRRLCLIRPHGHGHAQSGVKQREHETSKQTQLRVADLKGLLNRLL